MQLREGQLMTAPFLADMAEVKRFEPRTGYYRVEVVLQDGHQAYKSMGLTDEQLAQIAVVERSLIALADNAEDFLFSSKRTAYAWPTGLTRNWRPVFPR